MKVVQFFMSEVEERMLELPVELAQKIYSFPWAEVMEELPRGIHKKKYSKVVKAFQEYVHLWNQEQHQIDYRRVMNELERYVFVCHVMGNRKFSGCNVDVDDDSKWDWIHCVDSGITVWCDGYDKLPFLISVCRDCLNLRFD